MSSKAKSSVALQVIEAAFPSEDDAEGPEREGGASGAAAAASAAQERREGSAGASSTAPAAGGAGGKTRGRKVETTLLFSALASAKAPGAAGAAEGAAALGSASQAMMRSAAAAGMLQGEISGLMVRKGHVSGRALFPLKRVRLRFQGSVRDMRASPNPRRRSGTSPGAGRLPCAPPRASRMTPPSSSPSRRASPRTTPSSACRRGAGHLLSPTGHTVSARKCPQPEP